MTKLTIMRLAVVGLGGLAAMAAAGCQDKGHLEGDVARTDGHDRLFAAESQPRSVNTVLAAQAARGAAADGSLTAAHFDGEGLNGLGRQKLDAIVAGTGGGRPVTVYVNVDGDGADVRRAAVSAYLASAGVAADRVTVEAGANPASRHVASMDAGSLYRVEQGSLSGVRARGEGDGASAAGGMTAVGGRGE